MKLSIFTTMTNPISRGDNVREAFDCYTELADEVVVVDGNVITDSNDKDFHTGYHEDRGMKHLIWDWPKEFSWELIGQQFQRGYEACTGDWVIHADLDFLFHEKDFQAIREACESHSDSVALSFWKFQFILPDRYILKSRLVIAVNKRELGDRIRFDSGGDLCQPSLDGVELTPENVPQAKIALYNYEKLSKTQAQIKDDAGRMARAWHAHFGNYKLGGPDDESAYQKWLTMTTGRFNKKQQHIGLKDHPKYIQETIKNLKPEQWGYSGFGQLGVNDYV